MKRRNHNQKSVGKVVTGLLVGSVIGATVGWLTAPVPGREMRRRIADAANDSRHSIREKIEIGENNLENKARELAADIHENVDEGKETISRRRNAASTY